MKIATEMSELTEEERLLLQIKMGDWYMTYGKEAMGVINGLALENKHNPKDYPITDIIDMMEARLEEKLGYVKRSLKGVLAPPNKNPLTEPANHELSVLLRELKFGRPRDEQIALEYWAKIAESKDYSGFSK